MRQWPGNGADLDFRGVIKGCTALVVAAPVIEGEISERFIAKNARERAAFLESEAGAAAKKLLFGFRLWCVVELHAEVGARQRLERFERPVGGGVGLLELPRPRALPLQPSGPVLEDLGGVDVGRGLVRRYDLHAKNAGHPSAARHLLANLRQAALMQVPVEAAHTPIGMLRSFLRLHSERNWTRPCCCARGSLVSYRPLAGGAWPDVSNESDGVREA